jgi:hypothetical protein
MTKEDVIETLKIQYNRDIRKQLVKSLLEAEKSDDTLKQYTLMNQIFSYVLAQLDWNMPSGTEDWDPTPLEVMHEVFPKIMASKWSQEQQLMAKQHIDVMMDKTT